MTLEMCGYLQPVMVNKYTSLAWALPNASPFLGYLMASRFLLLAKPCTVRRFTQHDFYIG